MSTLSELYLESEPVQVNVRGEQLVIGLANGSDIEIPLQVVSQFASGQRIPADALILVVNNAPRIDHVHVSESALKVYLTDGRLLACPLSWFPRLVHGTLAERNNYELVGEESAIHWPDLDEDIDLERLFQGGPSTESENSIQRWLATRREHVTL